MTTNTDNRSIFNTPSLMVAKRIGSAVQTLAGMPNPSAVTTSSEARDVLGTLPGARLLGLHALGQYWADTFPKSDPTHPSEASLIPLPGPGRGPSSLPSPHVLLHH
jgi:hypothetical protein